MKITIVPITSGLAPTISRYFYYVITPERDYILATDYKNAKAIKAELIRHHVALKKICK